MLQSSLVFVLTRHRSSCLLHQNLNIAKQICKNPDGQRNLTFFQLQDSMFAVRQPSVFAICGITHFSTTITMKFTSFGSFLLLAASSHAFSSIKLHRYVKEMQKWEKKWRLFGIFGAPKRLARCLYHDSRYCQCMAMDPMYMVKEWWSLTSILKSEWMKRQGYSSLEGGYLTWFILRHLLLFSACRQIFW